MFEPSTKPRVFGTPIGVDFGQALISGLEEHLAGAQPESWGRVTILVNTTRMARHLRECFAAGPPRLMPRIRLVTALGHEPTLTPLEPEIPALRIRLQLRQAVARMIELQPDLAPHSAAFDLATSLAALMDEMDGEGVDPAVLEGLDVSGHSQHWERSLQLISILSNPASGSFRGSQALARDAAQAMLAAWEAAPPQDPVLVAGSTGSRGTTRLVMEAVARLPQGGIVLPGVDFCQPDSVWEGLIRSAADPEKHREEDHPQFRFAALLAELGLGFSDLKHWSGEQPAAPERNALVSLSLRPAPITDQWMKEGPDLSEELPTACENLTLIEAPSPRLEADAIALRLREAVEKGQRAAVITPDRTLARQITAALERWDILPDDSAPLPLHQSPPGRFLLETAALFGNRPRLASVLSLLKHPLAASCEGQRGPHLLMLREFEGWMRGRAEPFISAETLNQWASRGRAPTNAIPWAEWVNTSFSGLAEAKAEDLSARIIKHLELSENLATGPGGTDSGELWKAAAGEVALATMRELIAVQDAGGIFQNRDYSSLIRQFFSGKEVRHAATPHPLIAIWGTLEARTQSVDLAILAGLNEGSWPASLSHDPWMNRAMRQQAGLLLPERQIGLSAHDYQQALGACEVVLSRSLRDSEAETVPSRWLNRLTNLLGGLGEPGKTALEAMQERGAGLVDAGAELAHATATDYNTPAPRPSPCPPVETRPRGLYVTSVATLIRDPYAIYARHILKLRRLGPIAPQPDAAMRGTVLHAVMEEALAKGFDFGGDTNETTARFIELAARVIKDNVPWPATAQLWIAQFGRISHEIVAAEAALQAAGLPVVIEEKGSIILKDANFTLSAKPDRVDRLNSGTCAVFDYKSSATPPSKKQVRLFDKQLLLEAAIAERGGFASLGKMPVARVGYLSLSKPSGSRDEDLIDEGDEAWRPDLELNGLAVLVRRYDDPNQGYTARRAPDLLTYESDYDHLSRYGEWDDSAKAVAMVVG